MEFLSKIGPLKIIIILVCIVLLIVLSIGDISSDKNKKYEVPEITETINDNWEDEYVSDMEKRVEEILNNVAGAGEVKVMITLKSTSEKIALKDEPTDTSKQSETNGQGVLKESSSAKKNDSTIYEESGNDKKPYIIKEIKPEINGVAVVAGGGDNPAVKKEIIEAIQVLFGIEPHKIKVMKQK